MGLPPSVYSFLCACFAALGASLLGYDLGVISYVIVAKNFLSTIDMSTPDTYNDNYIGFIVSSMLLGAFVGSIPASLVADKWSRRSAISVAGGIFLLGGILQTVCQNRETMLAGRFFAGIGIGQLGVLGPLYQTEIAHPANRGRLGATFQLFIGFGVFVAGWIAYATSQTQPGTQMEWRLPLGFQNLPAVPLVFLTFFLPESPRWLMSKGRADEALATLARLRSKGDITDELVLAEFREMKVKVEEEAATDQSWSLILKDKHNFRKVFYGIIIQFSGQMTGVSAIQYYAPSIFKSVGFESKALLINSINNVMGIVGEVLCIVFLDRFGRRWTLITGNAITGTCFAVATAMASKFTEGGSGTRGDGIVFVAMVYLYNITFSACIGPLSWVIPVEMLNTSIRAKGVALTTMATWIANFMIGQISPHAFNSIGWKYYLVFTVGGWTNALTFYRLIPETKCRTLEEMDDLFRNSHWFIPFSKVQTLDAQRVEQRLLDELHQSEGQVNAVPDADEKASEAKQEYA